MAFKREKRLTKRERKELFGTGPKPPTAENASAYGAMDLAPDPSLPAGSHIHCVACGKHLDTVGEVRARQAGGALGGALWASLRCAHGSVFQACMGCMAKARRLLDEHDRSGKAVNAAAAWH